MRHCGERQRRRCEVMHEFEESKELGALYEPREALVRKYYTEALELRALHDLMYIAQHLSK